MDLLARTACRRLCAAIATLALAAQLSPAATPEDGAFPFRQNDVVAFLGGEAVVQELELGHLESLLTAAFPGKGVRYRNMGWEGDTVFEQPRDENFPGVPEQLKRVGATVVFCQFGRMESMAGADGLPAFVAAYEKLLDEIGRQTARVVLVTPLPFERPADPLLPDLPTRNADLGRYVEAVKDLGKRRGLKVADLFGMAGAGRGTKRQTEDGMRLTPAGSALAAGAVIHLLGSDTDLDHPDGPRPAHLLLTFVPQFDDSGRWTDPKLEALRLAVVEKNRLWFDYWRPMNWAFLGGNRTEQPSSRDPNDLSVRVFPAEMERFVPLIERAEARVEELANAVGDER